MIAKELLNPKSIGEAIDKEITKLYDEKYLVPGGLPKEEHIRSFVYSKLKPDSLFVQVEANYPNNSKECDLRIIKKDKTEIWVEIKIGWCGKTDKKGNKWANNLKEQYNRWIKDKKKLKDYLKKPKIKRCFILTAVIYNNPRESSCDKFLEKIKKINSAGRKIKSNIQTNNEIKLENFTRTQDKLYVIKTFVWVER